MKLRVLWLQERLLCALLLGVATRPDVAKGVEQLYGFVAANLPAAVPWLQISAKAGSARQSDELGVVPTEAGARLRCEFQPLEGDVTREGLWLTSTETHGANDRLRILAKAVGRGVDCGVRRPSAAATRLCPGWAREQADVDTERGAALCFRAQSNLLGRFGTVSVVGEKVYFRRPGLVEEYSLSMDGVRQDFILDQRPAGAGELVLRLAVSGAIAEPAAGGARLILDNSYRRIDYTRLHVTDATGKELGARMEFLRSNQETRTRKAEMNPGPVAPKSDFRNQRSEIVVVVDDAEAVYPVRIDPTFSDANWVTMNPSIPGTDGTVYAAVADASGNLYIGGDFTLVGALAANSIAKWNGLSWISLGPGIDGTVYTLAVSGSDVYAGGWFTTAGGGAANRIAKWDGTNWSALGSGMDSTVYGLAVSGDDVYAGGDFTMAGGSGATHIAKWNGTNWSALGSGVNGQVRALAASGSLVYVAGEFTTAGGSAATNIAQWSGTNWSPLGCGIGCGYNYGEVFALAVLGSNVYAGGWFTTAGGSNAHYVAKWDGYDWSALGSGMDLPVDGLMVLGSELYAGGLFTTAGDNPASHIARWDGSNWSALGSGMDDEVLALAVSGNAVYAGGLFATAGGNPADHIAKWDTSSWSALGSGSGMDSVVSALAASGSNVYAGGYFTTAGSSPAANIARWDGSSWSGLGSGMSSTPPDHSSVFALTVSGSNVYAGGWFATAGGNYVSNAAKWDGTKWSALGTGFNGPVYALAMLGSDVYAGGDFSYSLTETNYLGNIAKWDGTNWSALGSGMDGPVGALVVAGGDLYAGGRFTMAGGSAANNIAKWDGSGWSPLGCGIGCGSYYSSVNALAASGGDLYAGGYFTSAGGSPTS
jgi:hypothetical protein